MNLSLSFLFLFAAAPNPDSPLELLQALAAAAGDKNWLVLAPVAMLLAIYLVRTLFGAKIPWLKTDRGGAAVALATGLLGVFTATVMTPGPHSFASIVVALFTALVTNQALFILVNKLIAPSGAEAAKDVKTTADAKGADAQAVAAKSPDAAAGGIIEDLKK